MIRYRIALAAALALVLATSDRLPLRAADEPRASRPMVLADILAWKSIGSPVVSNDGRWFAYRLSPIEGDGEIVIRATDGNKEMRFPAGEVPPPPDDVAVGPPPAPPRMVSFADDSHWAAYTIYPSAKDARQLRRQNRPVQNKVGVVNLDTGQKVELDRVKRFAFAGERAGWIALHRYGPADGPPAPGAGAAGPAPGGAAGRPTDRPKGSDLILRELKSGA